MKTTRNLVYVLAIAFGISVLDGLFGWQLSDNLNFILGIIDIICIVLLVFLVSQKNIK